MAALLRPAPVSCARILTRFPPTVSVAPVSRTGLGQESTSLPKQLLGQSMRHRDLLGLQDPWADQVTIPDPPAEFCTELILPVKAQKSSRYQVKY